VIIVVNICPFGCDEGDDLEVSLVRRT